MQWFALYTKPKNEKKVVDRLTQMGIEVYCPMVTQVKQWSDRKKKVTLPLIPSYVFVRIAEKDRPLVFQVPGVVRYLFWLGKPAIVSATEIAQLQLHLASDYSSIVLETVAVGSKITLDTGFFKGQDATIQEIRSNTVKVYLEALGVVVIVEK